MIDAVNFEIGLAGRMVAGRLAHDRGYLAIQQISGVGPTLAAIFVAEIGDVSASLPPGICTPGPGSPPGGAATVPPSRWPAHCSRWFYYGLRDGHIRALTRPEVA